MPFYPEMVPSIEFDFLLDSAKQVLGELKINCKNLTNEV